MLRTILAMLAVTVAGATSASAAKAPPQLLHPETLTAKAPATFVARFTTSKGVFEVTVTRSLAPRGADRFYSLVKNGFFDGNKFFRVVPGFVVQWGISGHAKVSTAWANTAIPDDPVKGSNTIGTLTFATSGPNTRTTQVFVNLNNNTFLDRMGFSEFGKVTKGLKVVQSFYSGYGSGPTGQQGSIVSGGNGFLDAYYPKLDGVISARVVSP